MKLIVRNLTGLNVLRPSKLNWKVNVSKQGIHWENVLEKDGTRRLYSQDAIIPKGAHIVERIENPFVPGGEPWLVLKGSRIGAAEAYIRRLCAATRGTSNGVELVAELGPPPSSED
jgi:hypothetical protein